MYRVKVIPLNEKTENSPLNKEAIIDIENGHISVYKESEDKLVSATKKIVSEITKLKSEENFITEHFSDYFNNNLDKVNTDDFKPTYTDNDKKSIDYRIENIEKIFENYLLTLNECIRINKNWEEILDSIIIELNKDGVLDMSDIHSISDDNKESYFSTMDILRVKEHIVRYLKRNLPKNSDSLETTINTFENWLKTYHTNDTEKRSIPLLLRYYLYLKLIINVTRNKLPEVNNLYSELSSKIETLLLRNDYENYMNNLKINYTNLKDTYNSIIVSGGYNFVNTSMSSNGEFNIPLK